ncbi:hypothetical protein Q1695_015289 [Nippostrongylus brasiliensis]|nr:hypothetical protein Q1695_015289 [Nippostrongylus brasiliensis]
MFNAIVQLLLTQLVHSADLGGVLCRLPKDEGYECGSVGASYSAFHFDIDIGECIEFLFKGCGGNQNRFPSKNECMNGCKSMTLCGKGLPLMDFAGNIKRCQTDRVPCPGSHECIGKGMESVCCQKADRICSTSVHAGTPCGAPPQTRFYYDDASKLCRSFTFTGCGGNENNFKTKGECTQFCSSEIICPRGDPHPDRYSINKIATCHENKHCPRNYTCTARLGKKGACCPSKDFVCGSPLEERQNRRRILMESVWSFNYKTGGCEMHEHSVGDDQWNTFASQEQCVDYCVGSCPNGLDTHYNPLTGQPQLCDVKAKIGCPIGFECVKTSPFAAICCRTKPTCPAAESLLLLERGEPKSCDPDDRSSCPDRYSCQQAANLEHICCTRPLQCPFGMKALREDGGRPRACTLGVEGNCPDDHVCTLGDGMALGGGVRHLCCRPEKSCIVPYVDVAKKRPLRCSPGDTTCPVSTSCLAVKEENTTLTSATQMMFFCCHTVDVFTCPDGHMPLMDKMSRRPMRCSLSNPMSCSSEYVCQRLIDGSTACCPNPVADQTCTEAVLGDDLSPIQCAGWSDNSCQEGQCRQALDKNYYCCRASADWGVDASQLNAQQTKMRSEMLPLGSHFSDSRRIYFAPNVPRIGFSPELPHNTQFGARRGTLSSARRRRPVPYYLRRLQNIRNILKF